MQFNPRTIPFQLNIIPSSISRGGKKEEIQDKARYPCFPEPRTGKVQLSTADSVLPPRSAPGLLHLPHSLTGAIIHLYKTSPTHTTSLSSQLSLAHTYQQ